ncbi:hypothetical protein RNZ50_21450 [Paracoccaceae bacterium Fryx2]|nr:hypothetical protein [Paracoccaceae bacterium Fryx2]
MANTDSKLPRQDDLVGDETSRPGFVTSAPEWGEASRPDQSRDVPDAEEILRDLDDAPKAASNRTGSDAEISEGPFAAESARVQPVAAAAPRRRGAGGFFGLLLGGLIAAGMGFALARFAVPDGWPLAATGPMEARIATQATEITALTSAVAALRADLDARPVGATEDQLAPMMSDIAAANAALTAAAEAATALEERMTRLEQLPIEGGGMSPAALFAMQSDLGGLKVQVEELRAATAAMPAEIVASVEAAQNRLTEAEANANAIKAEAVATARAAISLAALSRVQAAIDSGSPYGEALTDLATSGVEVPGILVGAAGKGLPTLPALIDQFSEPARAALEASLRANMGEQVTDRISAFLRSQTGVRSLSPREGDDPDAVLSRMEAALRAGDLAGAVALLDSLPPEGKAAMEPWTALATLRLQATQATADLAAKLTAK